MSDLSDEDATICVSCSCTLENDTTHGQTDSTTPQPADRRPTNQVSAWHAEPESRPTRPTRATSSSHPREDVAPVGRVGEDDVTKMLRGNCSRGISALGWG